MSQESATESDLGSSETNLAGYIEPSILNALPHFLPLGIFPLLFLALIYGGWWLLPPFLFMSVVGPADRVFGPDGRNMDPKKTPERRLLWHNLPVWTWAFLWPPTLIFGMWQILVANPFAVWEEVILVFILTMEAQAVFMVGHELVHRRTTWERRVAEFLLASGSYPQYATEHVYIHHALVGTPKDLGSAPKGESFWRYFPKEVASNLTNSWRTARDRLARQHQPVWHYTNPFWRYGVGLLFWYGLAFWMGGIWAVIVFAFLGLCCVFSMKIINYCQHYGLRRVRLPNGRWEKVMPRHSWDADWKFSNWMFFKMQRHSDHHAMASRHYPLLQVRGADESPQLPGTYSDMMNLVIRPKRWFEKMDPMVDQWRDHFYPEIDDWSAYDSPLAASRPEAFDAIIEIFGAAPRLAKWIEGNPELLDTLQDREFTDLDLPRGFGPDLDYESTARRGLTRLYWTHEMNVQGMKEQIAEIPSTNAKETSEVVRNWSNDKAFQIGMHVIRKNLTPSEASTALSNLAEAVVSSILASVVADAAERDGPIQGGGIAAIFLGDLASKEVYPGIPVNVIFIRDEQDSQDITRIARGFRACLANMAKESLLFSPIPQSGFLCSTISISDLAGYCKEFDSHGVDLLTRAQCAFECGDSEIGRRFEKTRQEVIAEIKTDRSVLSTLNLEYEAFPESGIASYVQMRGGLNDIERTARILQLSNGDVEYDVPSPTATSIFRNGGFESLADVASTWRTLHGIQNLVIEEANDLLESGTKVKSLVAHACGYDDFDTLLSMVEESADQVIRDTEAITS